MRPEIHWLLHFCFENELLNAAQVSGLVATLDPATDAQACSERLASCGWIDDPEFLDSAVEAAQTNAQQGFELPALPGVATAPPAASPPEALEEWLNADELEALDDGQLCAAMEQLFIRCQQFGASDLHLPSGPLFDQTFQSEQLLKITKLSNLSNFVHIHTSHGQPLLFSSRVGDLGKISIYIKNKDQILADGTDIHC